MKSEIRSIFKRMRPVLPLYIFSAVFVVVPIAYTVFLSFMTRTDTWAVEYRFTLENYGEILSPIYLKTFSESFRLAVMTTVICIILGYPAGLVMGGMSDKDAGFFLKAGTFPFWINSVVRIAGVIILFRKGGLFGSLDLLYTYPAVVITMVYALIPFMIYSVYSSAAKMDRSAIEAAAVLGAGKTRRFFDIILPLTAGGLLNGVTLTFIPSMGLIYISALLGGGRILLVGNLIEDQLMQVKNVPMAAALSVVLMIFTGTVILLSRLLDPAAGKRRRAG